MTVSALAHELGVTKMEIFRAMQDLRLGVKRMSAQLNSKQEGRLRNYFDSIAKANRKRVERLAKERAARPVNIDPEPAPAAPRAEHEFTKTCNCCERRWLLKAADDYPTPVCPHCKGHYPQTDEPVERRLERAESHARLYWEERQRAWESASNSAREKEEAYDKRRKWMRALVQVVLDHDEGEDGLCWCGESYPCRTWKKLEEANKGIHRQVEKLASWDNRRLEDYLWGEGRYRGAGLGAVAPSDDDTQATA